MILPNPDNQHEVNQYLVTNVFNLVKDNEDFKAWQEISNNSIGDVNKKIDGVCGVVETLKEKTRNNENQIKWIMRIFGGFIVTTISTIAGYFKFRGG